MSPKLESRETVLKEIKRSIMLRAAALGTLGSETPLMILASEGKRHFTSTAAHSHSFQWPASPHGEFDLRQQVRDFTVTVGIIDDQGPLFIGVEAQQIRSLVIELRKHRRLFLK